MARHGLPSLRNDHESESGFERQVRSAEASSTCAHHASSQGCALYTTCRRFSEFTAKLNSTLLASKLEEANSSSLPASSVESLENVHVL